MQPDFYGKKRRKWGKKKGLPRYIKKTSKSQSRKRGIDIYASPYYQPHEEDETKGVFIMRENTKHKEYRKPSHWREKDKRRKELKTHIPFSVNKRKGWEMDFDEVEKSSSSSQGSDNDDEYVGRKNMMVKRKIRMKKNPPYVYRKKVDNSIYKGYVNHIKWFEENDEDYKEYLNHNKNMSKLSKKRQKRLKDKLRTIEYCKKLIRNEQDSKYVLDISPIEMMKDRKTVSRMFIKGKWRNKRKESFKKMEYLVKGIGNGGITRPKSKKRERFHREMVSGNLLL